MAEALWRDATVSSRPAEGACDGEPAAAACGVGADIGQADPDRGREGTLPSPSRRRNCINHVRRKLGVSERRARRTVGQHRSTQCKLPQGRADEQRPSDDIIEQADQDGRYGYRIAAGLLNNAGWHVNHKRVERIWRREGSQVPQKQKKKGAALAERRIVRAAQAGASNTPARRS